MTDPLIDATVRQTCSEPLQQLAAVADHAGALEKLVNWSKVAVLYDEQPTAVLVLLLDNESVVAVFRIALSPAESANALELYAGDSDAVSLGCCQGAQFERDQVRDLAQLTALWASASKKDVSPANMVDFFGRIEDETRTRGRGANVLTNTRNQVLFDARGRCMFEGCALDLTRDPTTGIKANYGTFAHNIGSSESGPRGVIYLSDELANEPDNILLLCDVHHRIVDTIAKADYPASRLQEMRRRFCDEADAQLDRLQLMKIPAYCVAWPVRKQTIASPTPGQIADALVPIGARLDGQLSRIFDNDELLMGLELDPLWQQMPSVIEMSAQRILDQSRGESFRAALFAMGYMPALTALGAKLGNKNLITPMLLHRETSLWYWPAPKPRGDWYDVSGLDALPAQCDEVTLEVALTGRPPPMTATSEALRLPTISLIAHDEWLGNGALGHPHDGRQFRQRVQELLHELVATHGVKRVHLLICASNAASVFLGQAYDNYHPDLLIYDFNSDGPPMIPRLLVRNVGSTCVVEAAPDALGNN